ncbi:prepilin-type N-terminal cleavage/methylation domain-containing protein [Clostridium massiliamazoniense]|uniref:prepilin-type N-terminal cleavage/methylation domain-containing protein n=1 Tax=Clostridium massiliamazoniense TaxID=1347366 RepID=UPI0006D81A4E|nr:prepilin-type N-terminal cleavage/methylation domain-containing protein [Clostridium massiliamazoniense]
MLKCNKKILKKLKQKKKGFTLLEIVVALAVIGIMIVPLGGALLTSVKTNKMGEIKQESKLISQEIIEKIRSFGDIKDSMTFNVGKEQGDSISITKNSSNNKLYNVTGSLTDSEGATMVEGEIIEQGDLKEDFGSKKYLSEKFGLFIYIQNHKENNKISIYKSSGKTIDEYLNDTPNTVIENSMDLKIEIGDTNNKNKLLVNGKDMGSLVSTDITRGNIGEIAIYVEEPREVNDLVSLHLNNKNTKKDDKVQLYFFNNKLHDISHDETNDPRTDSFKRDRYINGEFEIFDNITYYKETERLNKGLYTITLEFRKKIPNGTTVTEKTQSEFMVDN